VERVACYKLTAKHAEWAGELWARRWIDYRGCACNRSDVMRTLTRVLLLAVLLSFLLPATATAQGKEDLKSVRADNSAPFYMGYITGLTNGYIAANLVTCPRPVNGVMVLGVLDSNSHPYDDRTPEAAVLHALVDLGCPADSAAASDVRPR
jgi:hypothetical protein